MKNNIRKKILKKRLYTDIVFVLEAEKKTFEIFKQSRFSKFDSYMLYNAIKNELQVSMIMDYLFSAGKKISVPVVDVEKGILSAKISVECIVKTGKYDIREPETWDIQNPGEIEVILVPGVAFNIYGDRIGYGKGYYDKFLPFTSAVKIGVCYEFQLIADNFEANNEDIPMDYILTEERIFKVENAI